MNKNIMKLSVLTSLMGFAMGLTNANLALGQGFDWSAPASSPTSPLNPVNPYNRFNPLSPWHDSPIIGGGSGIGPIGPLVNYDFQEVRGYSPSTSSLRDLEVYTCDYGWVEGDRASSGLWYTSLCTDLNDAAKNIFKLGDRGIGLFFYAEISCGFLKKPGFRLKAAYDLNRKLDFSGKNASYFATYTVRDRDHLNRNAQHLLRIFQTFGKTIKSQVSYRRDENCPTISNPRIENKSRFKIDLRWDRLRDDEPGAKGYGFFIP